MKSFCGFGALLMLGLLFADIVTDAGLGSTIFHLVLFFGNVICMNIDE